ncbi:MAG: methyltransferase domain-containing protein [Candidatus Omnitrophota bacterium]|jgi:tRNA (cmo5U34)-methyltransferase
MSGSYNKRILEIKRHFEREAKIFDKCFFKVAPFYKEAIETLVLALPFKNGKKLKVIDLGCGTGNITMAVKERYPDASVVCIDLAQNMLELAKVKLNKYGNIEYWLGDIRDYDYIGKCGAVVSSLVLHHLDKEDKRRFYRRIHSALPAGGVFYIADFVLPSNGYLAKVYVEEWKKFMAKSLTPPQIAKTLANHKREDRPAELMFELALLRESGFKEVDVIWKRYNFCVYGGVSSK